MTEARSTCIDRPRIITFSCRHEISNESVAIFKPSSNPVKIILKEVLGKS